jgi:formate/nitrite transporter FocA (FNT family)
MAMHGGGGSPMNTSWECLSTPQVLHKAADVGEIKVSSPPGRSFLLAVMAGLFIATGAACMLVVKSDSSLGFASSQILGGVVFSVGLVLVVVAGAELFTGNNLMVIGCLSRRYSPGKLVGSWLMVYAGNFLGSLSSLWAQALRVSMAVRLALPLQVWPRQRHPSRQLRLSVGELRATCWCVLRSGCRSLGTPLPISSFPA